MKNKSFLVGIVTILFSLQACQAQTSKTELNDGFQLLTHSVNHPSASNVVSPIVPNHILFCSDTLFFDRETHRENYERLDRELINFSYMHSITLRILKRTTRYFPIIEPILKKQGVPDDFKYLMAIECNMNETAVSPVGAAGMWQFMKATGREYQLEINKNIDERYHIEKSTYAACAYLKDSYARFGDWTLVAMSYNAGANYIQKKLDKQKTSNGFDIWMNSETARYVFRIVALKTVHLHPHFYGFNLQPQDYYPPQEYTYYTIQTGIPDLVDWALKHQVTYYQLKQANRWLRDDYLENKSGRTYIIRLPKH